MFELSFNEYIQYAMYFALAGTVICAIIFFWPSPKWVRESRVQQEVQKMGDIASKNRQIMPALIKALSLFGLSFLLVAILIIFFRFPMFFSLILSLALIAMIYPMVTGAQNKRRIKAARAEALSIAEFVAGRMSAQTPLFESLENLYAEFLDGKRELPLSGEDLGEAIRHVRLGNDLETELFAMAIKFHELPALRQVWTTYSLMTASSMGQEAEIYQASDLSESQNITDELANVLETEMSTATMSRIAMFVLIGGMTLFLIFFGEGMGDVLVNTIPGNLLVGFSLFTLFLAQMIGSKLEELPTLEF